MKLVLCPELAPIEIHTLLKDWHTDQAELAEFIDMLTTTATPEGFDISLLESTPEIDACEVIMYILKALILSEMQREEFLQEENPQDDFEEDLDTWDGIILAIMFAGDAVLRKILAHLPVELYYEGLSRLPKESRIAVVARLGN